MTNSQRYVRMHEEKVSLKDKLDTLTKSMGKLEEKLLEEFGSDLRQIASAMETGR